MAYTLRDHIRLRLNFIRAIVHVQGFLENIPVVPDTSSYTIEELDPQDAVDASTWLDIVHDAYDGEHNDASTFTGLFTGRHLFLDVCKVYVLRVEDEAAGTIALGTYRDFPTIGGITKFAVKSAYQGKGLGRILLLYAYHQLRAAGIKYGCSIIAIKRPRSILLHFRCGFFPQYRRKYQLYTAQKRSLIVRLCVLWKLRSLHRSYMESMFRRYLSVQQPRLE